MINIIGTIQDSTGYSIHSRNLVNALSKITDVRLTTNIQPGTESTLTDKELEIIKRKPEDDEINLVITNPMLWKVNCTAKRNWVYMIWEGDRIPRSFVEECMNPDIEYIFCPSEHTKQAIENTLDDMAGEETYNPQKKIKIIPHGVNLDLFYPKSPQSAPSSEDTIFLANKGFRNLEDRGGIQYLIKAYLEEFNNEDKVELIVKINPAYGIPNMQKIVEELDIQNKLIPKMTVDTNLYKYEDLVKLYHRGDVFISPTRAESFNIPCIEAMACGLPVLTTNFGGQTDYVNEENGWIIGGELTEVQHEVLYEGIKWLTPSIKELRTKLREIHNGKTQRKKGKKAQEVAKKYTWDSTANKIVKLIQTFI